MTEAILEENIPDFSSNWQIKRGAFLKRLSTRLSSEKQMTVTAQDVLDMALQIGMHPNKDHLLPLVPQSELLIKGDAFGDTEIYQHLKSPPSLAWYNKHKLKQNFNF